MVKNSPHLYYLMIDNTSVTGRGLTPLVKLKNLQFLHVATLNLTDEDLKPVLDSHNLEAINLSENSDITDETIKRLLKMSNLKKVQLTRCNRLSKGAVASLKEGGRDVVHATMIEASAVSQDVVESMLGE